MLRNSVKLEIACLVELDLAIILGDAMKVSAWPNIVYREVKEVRR